MKILLLHAAALIAEDARLTREACRIGSQNWACADCDGGGPECDSRRHYEDADATSKKLIAAAEGNVALTQEQERQFRRHEWTAEDWKDFYRTLEGFKLRILERAAR